MPDGVTPADPGLLASLADELALPGYAMRNMLLGRTGAAGRNLADFALNAVDAPLPGDWIPEISGAEDRPEFTDITGPIDDGLTGSLVNVAGNILTDPVTYIPGAAVAKAGGMAAKAAKAVTPKIVQEGVAKVAKPVGKFMRKVAGAEKIGKPLASVVTKAQGAREVTARAGGDALVEGLKGASQRELDAAGEVMLNITKDKATGALRAIDESDTLSVQDRLARYLTENPDVDPAKLADIVQKSGAIGKAQWESGKAAGPGGNIFADLAGQPSSDVVMGAVPGTTGQQGIREYFPRIFQGEDEALAMERAASPSAIKGRKLETTQDVLAYLAEHPEMKLTTNAAEALSQRAAQQAELASRGATGSGLMNLAREQGIELPDELLAKALPMSRPAADVNSMLATGGRGVAAADKAIAATPDVVMGGAPQAAAKTGLSEGERKQAREWLLSRDYKQADPLMRETAEAIAKNLPGDEADVALHFLKGMEGRTGLPKALAALNRQFKPVAVYGAVIPKLGSITRNMTGGVWQKYSNPEARGVISPKNIPMFMRDWLASIEDGVERLIGKRIFTKNEFSEMDEAFKAGGGDPRKALALIKDPTMRAAAERGIFGNNFVDTEGLIAQAGRTGLRNFGEKLWDYPGHMFKGAEQRMRYGLFKQLKAAGKTDDDAARVVRESFYDYSISSAENRLARDIVPFFQFLGKSTVQQAKLLAEKPALASTVANLYAQGRDEPVLPYMEGKVNLPMGTDEQGNRQYLSNLGLPFESLSVLPNLSANPLQAGRDIEQNFVGSSSPLLKAAYAYTSGRDPVFGSAPGSYTKVAGQDLGEAGGILNQLLATGLSPAVAAQQFAGKVGQFTDERTSLGDLALNQLTGVRAVSVDPDRAVQQRLQSYLERDPSVGQFRKFFARGEDDVVAQEMLSALKTAKDRQKEKQKAMAPVN
jgi:hypothetical protein